MNDQLITKSEDKSANKNKSKKQQSPGEAEIHLPPAVMIPSPVPKRLMIATNLMGLLDGASTADMHSSPVQKAPPRGFHQRADKPQAASD